MAKVLDELRDVPLIPGEFHSDIDIVRFECATGEGPEDVNLVDHGHRPLLIRGRPGERVLCEFLKVCPRSLS